jgi:hypothetical protein
MKGIVISLMMVVLVMMMVVVVMVMVVMVVVMMNRMRKYSGITIFPFHAITKLQTSGKTFRRRVLLVRLILNFRCVLCAVCCCWDSSLVSSILTITKINKYITAEIPTGARDIQKELSKRLAGEVDNDNDAGAGACW